MTIDQFNLAKQSDLAVQIAAVMDDAASRPRMIEAAAKAALAAFEEQVTARAALDHDPATGSDVFPIIEAKMRLGEEIEAHKRIATGVHAASYAAVRAVAHLMVSFAASDAALHACAPGSGGASRLLRHGAAQAACRASVEIINEQTA